MVLVNRNPVQEFVRETDPDFLSKRSQIAFPTPCLWLIQRADEKFRAANPLDIPSTIESDSFAGVETNALWGKTATQF